MNLPQTSYDVIIIGSGPAGCACALALYNSNLRVALIDKEAFPRDKICGDAIPGQTLKAIDLINPDWGKALREFRERADIQSSKIFAPNGKTITLNWKMLAYNSKRIDFDNFLTSLVKNETSTAFLENKRLQQIKIENDQVICDLQGGGTIRAAVIIGCDGANSIVERQTRQDNVTKANLSAAVRAYFSGVEGIETGVNEFHLFDELPGYFWIFPLENGFTNVGFGVSGNDIKKSGNAVNLRNSLSEIIKDYPGISNRFKKADMHGEIKGFGLPVWKNKKSLSGHRYMLCGDAASLIDPLQGHGIDKAVWSGFFAANQAIKCFKVNNFSASYMREYDKALYEKIGFELARSLFILKLITKYPGLISLFARLGSNKKIISWITQRLKI